MLLAKSSWCLTMGQSDVKIIGVCLFTRVVMHPRKETCQHDNAEGGIRPTGHIVVTLQRFSDADLAQIKQIPGRRWDPERKQWLLPDMAEVRTVLAEIVAAPPKSPVETLTMVAYSSERY
jgi:hypothetical protein